MFVDMTNAAAAAQAVSQDAQAKKGGGVTEDGRTMAQVLADVVQAAEASGDSRTMTVAEYRSYIFDKISELPVDSSQALASHSVHITEAGLAAMRDDPEYEAWVLDQLKQNFAFKDPWTQVCGGSYHVHQFGASKEEYLGESWFPGYAGGRGGALYESKAAGSMWRRDTPKVLSKSASDVTLPDLGKTEAERKKDAYADLQARLRMERLLSKQALERRNFQSEMLEQASKHRQAVEKMHQTGQKGAEPASPVPQFHGVPAAFLLGMLGGGISGE